MTTQYNYSLADPSLLYQRSNNFYSTSDASFVFEFVPMNVNASFQVVPLFQPYTEASNTSGFTDVSATAYITAPALNFSKLFCFQSNDITFADYPNQDISYGISNANTLFNISFSQALVKNGWANPATQFTSNTSTNQDYIRYTAKAITGGYALSDIFANEVELIQGVNNMDASFNLALNTNISTYYNNTSNTLGMARFPNASLTNPYMVACKQLLDGLLTNASNPRGNLFLSDLAAQSPNASSSAFGTNTYYINFRAGDVLAVRLAYIPQNGNNSVAGTSTNLLGTNKLYTRTYKMFIQFT